MQIEFFVIRFGSVLVDVLHSDVYALQQAELLLRCIFNQATQRERGKEKMCLEIL